MKENQGILETSTKDNLNFELKCSENEAFNEIVFSDNQASDEPSQLQHIVENEIFTFSSHEFKKRRFQHDTYDEDMCVICYDDEDANPNLRYTCFLPCKHSAVCVDCSNANACTVCPLCKCKIDKIDYGDEAPEWVMTESGQKQKIKHQNGVFRRHPCILREHSDAGFENGECKGEQELPAEMLGGFKQVIGHTYQLKANEFWAGYDDLRFHLNLVDLKYRFNLVDLKTGNKPFRFGFPMKRTKKQYGGPDHRFFEGDCGEIYATNCIERPSKECFKGFSAKLNISGLIV